MECEECKFWYRPPATATSIYSYGQCRKHATVPKRHWWQKKWPEVQAHEAGCGEFCCK